MVDKKGGIYFTDCYQVGAKKSPDDLPQAVYYIQPRTVRKSCGWPTTSIGRMALRSARDEKILYVNDWDGSYLLTYDVQSDGTLKNRKSFGKYTLKQETDHGMVSGADGLCIDSQSHLYATTPAGVQVFNSKGEHLATLKHHTTCRRRTVASQVPISTICMLSDAASSIESVPNRPDIKAGRSREESPNRIAK